MNPMMRAKTVRIIISVIIIVALILSFSSCSPKESASDENDQPNNESTTDPSNDPEPEPEPETEITESELAALIQQGQQLTEYAYTVTMTSDFGTTSSKIWIKGDNVKMESSQDGKPYIMLYDKDASYTLDVTNKTALKMSWDDDGMEMDDDPVSFDNLPDTMDDETLTLLGKEVINGEPCFIVESVNEDDDSKVKMWIHEEYGFTMRVEFVGDDPSENVVSETSDLQVGNISDDVFVIPSDYQVIEWDDMMDLPDDWMDLDEE
ncbi:DUF4412 domain-containing protein [Alkalibacter rhizosphaerae]|uniref:DUF4412 domain-containing protein n=1 Tax=Alkalibacter rhizosphaerae TaxID=2815577 RepID=A0A974XGX0_9FIRM|nr:DUF4412 domain-containing protein [Alkalibacter rhizosphaerae]QSX08420.1 DUF4412 domain-containing protein [Alkalibacter rhizosphaerae]